MEHVSLLVSWLSFTQFVPNVIAERWSKGVYWKERERDGRVNEWRDGGSCIMWVKNMLNTFILEASLQTLQYECL